LRWPAATACAYSSNSAALLYRLGWLAGGHCAANVPYLQEKVGSVQDMPVDLIRLIYMGQEMMDEGRALDKYGIGNMAEIYAVRRLAPSRPPRR